MLYTELQYILLEYTRECSYASFHTWDWDSQYENLAQLYAKS